MIENILLMKVSVYQINVQNQLKQRISQGITNRTEWLANKTKRDISRISFGNQQYIRHLYSVLFVRLGTQSTCETLPYIWTRTCSRPGHVHEFLLQIYNILRLMRC
ncbi:Hypothetical_protein [Hexamita inflata]|uniref:Hypothetical_protein n=1 Tax=Hexamita inflata TaxID=28002 RepID=A0AA86PY90_9EUKA|nr:Hypothetical protein HINF_LOCUS35128 [Hexamita inflata]